MVDFSNFRSWVESQPPERSYDYTSTFGCALALFLMASGERDVVVQPEYVITRDSDGFTPLPRGLDDAVSGRSGPMFRDGVLSHDPARQTFGALAERLKKLEVA